MKDATIRLLRWSEKYTKTDMVYLVKNSGWLFLGQITTSAAAFASMIILVNYIEKTEYGEYRFIISVILLLSIFSLPGIAGALMQSTARGYDGQMSIVINARKKWSLIASAISLLVCGYYFLQDNINLSLSFFVASFALPFFNTYQIHTSYLQGKQLYKLAALLQIITQLSLAFFVGLAAFFQASVIALVSIYLGISIVFQYGSYCFVKNKIQQTIRIDEDLVSYGKYLTLYSSLPSTIAAQVGIIVIWFYLGDLEAAIFAVAMMFPIEIIRFGTILSNVAIPKMTRQTIDAKALLNKTLKFVILMSLIWLLYALIAPWIFQLLLPSYSHVVGYSTIAMITIVFLPRILLQSFFYAQKNKKVVTNSAIAAATTQVLLNIILVPLFGVIGAIYAFLFTAFLELGLLLFFIYKNFKKNDGDTF